MTRASKATWTVLLACLSAVFVTTSHAQDAVGVEKLTGTLAKIRSTGSVTIGYRDASIPFSYLGPGRQPIGYSIDLCLAVVDEIKNYPKMGAYVVHSMREYLSMLATERFNRFNLSFGLGYDFKDQWGVSRATFEALTLGTLAVILLIALVGYALGRDVRERAVEIALETDATVPSPAT